MDHGRTEEEVILETSKILESVVISVHQVLSRFEDDTEAAAQSLSYFVEKGYPDLGQARYLMHVLADHQLGEEKVLEHLKDTYYRFG